MATEVVVNAAGDASKGKSSQEKDHIKDQMTPTRPFSHKVPIVSFLSAQAHNSSQTDAQLSIARILSRAGHTYITLTSTMVEAETGTFLRKKAYQHIPTTIANHSESSTRVQNRFHNCSSLYPYKYYA